VEALASEEKKLGHGRPRSHFLEEKKTRKTHRILAINGAGARAVICLAYLEYLELLLGQRLKSPSFRLSNYFDLIGGTSVGSLIAAGLALGAKVTDLRDVLFEGVPKWSRRGTIWRNKLGWNEKAIQKSIMEVCGTDTLGSERFKSGFAAIMKRMDTGRMGVATNNPRSLFGFRSLQLKDVVRASIGRPGTLEPVKIQIEAGQESAFFLDAALCGFADPSLALLLTAILPSHRLNWAVGPRHLMLVSVGSGTWRPRLDRAACERGLTASNLDFILSTVA
jgi:patatin-like phospholipase